MKISFFGNEYEFSNDDLRYIHNEGQNFIKYDEETFIKRAKYTPDISRIVASYLLTKKILESTESDGILFKYKKNLERKCGFLSKNFSKGFEYVYKRVVEFNNIKVYNGNEKKPIRINNTKEGLLEFIFDYNSRGKNLHVRERTIKTYYANMYEKFKLSKYGIDKNLFIDPNCSIYDAERGYISEGCNFAYELKSKKTFLALDNQLINELALKLQKKYGHSNYSDIVNAFIETGIELKKLCVTLGIEEPHFNVFALLTFTLDDSSISDIMSYTSDNKRRILNLKEMLGGNKEYLSMYQDDGKSKFMDQLDTARKLHDRVNLADLINKYSTEKKYSDKEIALMSEDLLDELNFNILGNLKKRLSTMNYDKQNKFFKENFPTQILQGDDIDSYYENISNILKNISIAIDLSKNEQFKNNIIEEYGSFNIESVLKFINQASINEYISSLNDKSFDVSNYFLTSRIQRECTNDSCEMSYKTVINQRQMSELVDADKRLEDIIRSHYARESVAEASIVAEYFEKASQEEALQKFKEWSYPLIQKIMSLNPGIYYSEAYCTIREYLQLNGGFETIINNDQLSFIDKDDVINYSMMNDEERKNYRENKRKENAL